MQSIMSDALIAVQILSAILVFVIGLGLLAALIMFAVDRTQTASAVRRNFPVIGRFRYAFERLGEFEAGTPNGAALMRDVAGRGTDFVHRLGHHFHKLRERARVLADAARLLG